jgi:Holliday junction resolvasome RuvABC endonuclease subunit
MTKIKVVGFDPSTTNWGIAVAEIDVDTLEVEIVNLLLVETESETKKGVRKDSDSLRRAREVYGSMILVCTGAAFAISEIPFMTPQGYATSNFNSGLVTGVLSACPIPLIQVFPQEVKALITGSRHAAKEEIIEWAVAKHPDAPWKRVKRGGKMVLTNKNEHLADAVAAIYAGLQSEQFKQGLTMMRAINGKTLS